jgi:hypothetical protein
MLNQYKEHHHGWAAHFFVVQLGPSLILLALLPVWHNANCLGRCRPGYHPIYPVQTQCSACLFQQYLPLSDAEPAVAQPEPVVLALADHSFAPVAVFPFEPSLPPANGPPA